MLKIMFVILAENKNVDEEGSSWIYLGNFWFNRLMIIDLLIWYKLIYSVTLNWSTQLLIIGLLSCCLLIYSVANC